MTMTEIESASAVRKPTASQPQPLEVSTHTSCEKKTVVRYGTRLPRYEPFGDKRADILHCYGHVDEIDPTKPPGAYTAEGLTHSGTLICDRTIRDHDALPHSLLDSSTESMTYHLTGMSEDSVLEAMQRLASDWLARHGVTS